MHSTQIIEFSLTASDNSTEIRFDILITTWKFGDFTDKTLRQNNDE
jgi:hypothetical protein